MLYPALFKKWDRQLRAKFRNSLDSLRNLLLLKIITYIISFLFLYVFLPVYLVRQLDPASYRWLFLFYLVNGFLIFYLLKKNSNRKYQLEYQSQELQEKINILNEQNSQRVSNKVALQEKINRYNSLKEIIEEINKNLDLEYVADKLVSIAFSLIANNKGVCIMYLLDSQTQKLSIFKTKKEDKKLIIKAKEGNIFDFWVLQHTSPLLIEDIKKDFRFDLEKLKSQDTRTVSSLISSPLVSEHRFLGILRLDHPDPYFFSQDDLRFLMTLCDLGAVALENGELFKKTQDLAIHDELTSVYTKGYFLERLREEYKRSVRRGRSISLLMLDIDHFKDYNDKFGHTAGDIVLKILSQNIVEGLKELSPIISRFGGEEFCIVIHGLDKKKIREVAEGLRTRIEKTKVILRRQESNVTVSIGVAYSSGEDISGEDELILAADKAMYEAKQKGRNRVCGI
jgi:diguanylate cyclase (GGDEF)-like protein